MAATFDEGLKRIFVKKRENKEDGKRSYGLLVWG